MIQILAHIFGDYILQSDWMAMNKSKRTLPCLVHVLLYTSVFLFLTTSWKALLVIGGVHFILDRWPVIIRKLIWFKNHLNPSFAFAPWDDCKWTGYFDNFGHEINNQVEYKPFVRDRTQYRVEPRFPYITIWLYIITDNFLHLLTNYLALKYLV